jgi:regulator of RNase E activity RraA
VKHYALLVSAACLALAACQTTAPTPTASGERPGTSDAAHALYTSLTDRVKACWFSGNATFAGYAYTAEIVANAPRILIFPKNARDGRPVLVIEPTGSSSASIYGPLLAAPAGVRAKSDLDRWMAGGTGCA